MFAGALRGEAPAKVSSYFELTAMSATTSTDGLRMIIGVRTGQWIGRILEIRHQVVRGPTGGAFDVRIFDDGLIEVDKRLVK